MPGQFHVLISCTTFLELFVETARTAGVRPGTTGV